MTNPYWGASFSSFYALFFSRLGHLLTGQLKIQDLASDEVQVIALLLLALSSALVGTFLVLKKMTMLANSLSHTILLGIVGSVLIVGGNFQKEFGVNQLVLAAVIAGVLTALLSQLLTSQLRLQEDASIGLVFTFLFALGVVLVTVYTRSMHLGLEAVMGSIDAIHIKDLTYLIGVTALNYTLFLLFFKEFTIVAFDRQLAHVFGFIPHFFNYLLMFLLSLTAVAAFRVVGVLLVLSFFVGLPLTARLWCHRVKTLIVFAVLKGLLVSFLAVSLSRHFLSYYGAALSTSALASVLITIGFTISILISPRLGLLNHLWRKKSVKMESEL